ncbi:MAG TPA: hypothetical protein DHW65_10560 [Dehalococcoidia bacterium]|nr:hypothetical protein [Dehalococcoidia bacterium]
MDDIEHLVTTKATPTLFPDVKEALGRLQGKYRLAVLSNGDLWSLGSAVSGLGIPVETAISAEQAGYYKPHPQVYLHGVRELGLSGEQVLHVAAHAWDVRGARQAGMAGAYVNRKSLSYLDAEGSEPELEILGLSGLADELLAE